MSPSHPSSSDLGRLLELLLLCHKYLAAKLEAHIVAQVTQLTRADVLASNLSKNVTAFRVIEVARIVNQPELATRARALALTDLWSDHSKSPYEALLFGERMGDKEIIGAAYYQTLLYRWPMWSLDRRLTDQHRRHLKYGMTRCGEEWQKIFDAWGILQATKGEALEHQNDHKCTLQDNWLQGIWQEIAKSKLQWFDVIGKLCVAIQFAAQYDCFDAGRRSMEAEMERIKASLYACFVPEEAIALKISELQLATK